MNQYLADALQREVTRLNPSPVVELFEFDSTPCGDGGEVLHFHNGTQGYSTAISFRGVVYQPLPIQVKGFELSGTGTPPRPTLSIMNAGGFVSSLVLKLSDLIGAVLTRRRTFARFLDGEPDAADVQYPPDIFFVVQKTREDRLLVEFELGSGLDLDGVQFPGRTITSSYCQHVYRGQGCRFLGQYVVASKTGPLPGLTRYRGTWLATNRYSPDDVVWFDPGVGGLYQCIAGAVITGDENSPMHTDLWVRLQRYLGEYNPASSYVKDDVVFRSVPQYGRNYYIATRPVPATVSPPNEVFWTLDFCGKSISNCRWRFDPLKINRLPLPFGGFPGTLTIPEI